MELYGRSCPTDSARWRSCKQGDNTQAHAQRVHGLSCASSFFEKLDFLYLCLFLKYFILAKFYLG